MLIYVLRNKSSRYDFDPAEQNLQLSGKKIYPLILNTDSI